MNAECLYNQYKLWTGFVFGCFVVLVIELRTLHSTTELQLPAPGDYLLTHLFIHLDAGDWTQGPTCIIQMFYHWAVRLCWRLFFKKHKHYKGT